MKKVWEAVKDFFERDWTVAEKILIIVCCILAGMVKGFLIAPVKRGVCIGSNNANIWKKEEEECWLDEED